VLVCTPQIPLRTLKTRYVVVAFGMRLTTIVAGHLHATLPRVFSIRDDAFRTCRGRARGRGRGRGRARGRERGRDLGRTPASFFAFVTRTTFDTIVEILVRRYATTTVAQTIFLSVDRGYFWVIFGPFATVFEVILWHKSTVLVVNGHRSTVIGTINASSTLDDTLKTWYFLVAFPVR